MLKGLHTGYIQKDLRTPVASTVNTVNVVYTVYVFVTTVYIRGM